MLERHLGLVTCAELDDAQAKVRTIGEIVGAQVDLGRARARRPRRLAARVPRTTGAPVSAPRGPALRIGIARDRAFGFYYPDDLDALAAAGAEVVPFDTLHGARAAGARRPDHRRRLSRDPPRRARGQRRAAPEIGRAIEGGLPAYAECGGLMYLARSITWQGRTARMVGVIPGDAVMHERPVGRGYVHLAQTAAMPWTPGAAEGLRGHEFHHSSLENLDPGVAFAYRVERGHGVDGRHDGIVVHRLRVLRPPAQRRHAVGAALRRLRAPRAQLRVSGAPRIARRPTVLTDNPRHDDEHADRRAALRRVDGRRIATDSEGYLVDRDDWSEDFARALARHEGPLTAEHWEVIRFLREYFQEHGVQAQVRVMIRHFAQALGPAARQQPPPARPVPGRRAAEAGQPPRRVAAHEGRALSADPRRSRGHGAPRRRRPGRPRTAD